METPNLPAIRALRLAWNKGRFVVQRYYPVDHAFISATSLTCACATLGRQILGNIGERLFQAAFTGLSLSIAGLRINCSKRHT